MDKRVWIPSVIGSIARRMMCDDVNMPVYHDQSIIPSAPLARGRFQSSKSIEKQKPRVGCPLHAL